VDRPRNAEEREFYRDLLIKLICTDPRRGHGGFLTEDVARDAAALADDGLSEYRKRVNPNASP
jgi:hypothetical protein